MKKIIIILLSFTAMFISCSKSEVWLDNDNPGIYFPQEGVSINTTWLLENNEYIINFGVYLSGVRPENQNANIDVTFNHTPSLITMYNNDVTQTYAGRVVELPSDCFQITGNKTTIAKGNVSAVIPIKVFTDKLNALPKTNAFGKILYTVPLKLASATDYILTADTNALKALCTVQVDIPRFYFWVNRALTTSMGIVGRKVIFGQTPATENFTIAGYGVPNDQDYTLNFDINPDAAVIPSGGLLLPADAYELTASSITIPKGSKEGKFPVKIINDNVGFRQVYYLPVRIATASKYTTDSVKGTLLLKVEAKNNYEWSYSSKISSTITRTQRGLFYSLTKGPVSYDAETLTFQMSTNTTNANLSLPISTGWTSTGWTGDFVAGFSHSTGNTNVLSQSNPVIPGNKYKISYTVSGSGTVGSFTIGLGGQTSAAITATGSGSITVTAATAANLTITPTSTFVRKVVVSVSSDFNDIFYRLKIIPNPANNRKWGVEIIKIADYVPATGNTPLTLEFDPAQESYYDWDYETFYLYYRFKDGGFPEKWVNVSEILIATFF